MKRREELRKRNRICRRLEFLIEGRLKSPLMIGSGESEETNIDVLLGADYIPYIPGTSIAGITRSFSVEEIGERETKQLFGSGEEWIEKEDKGEEREKRTGRQSSLYFSDAVLEDAVLGMRDAVRLDKYKTAEDKANFTMQIVEPNAKFRIHISLVERELDKEKRLPEKFSKILKAFSLGELSIGAKKNRGFGKLKITKIRQKEFSLTEKEGFLQWLDFRWEEEEAWKDAKEYEFPLEADIKKRFQTLSVPLKLKGSIMIRRYSQVEFGKNKNPSYQQQAAGEIPIIPGSTWAGAIRGRIASILAKITGAGWEECQIKLEEFFGTWKQKEREEELKASKVSIEESEIKGGHKLFLSRTAIDRFTGGTVKGALYSEIPWVEGQTELVFHWSDTQVQGEKEEVLIGMLLWAILDLQKGLLAVGGETAVGRGIFEKDGEIRLDREILSEEKRNLYLKKAAEWSERKE